MFLDKPIRELFRTNHNWFTYLNNNKDNLREVVIENVTKMMNCATSIYGSRHYTCSHPNCTHSKYIHQTCKSRACSSCGMKATEQWIQKQTHILPDCDYQHITFTMPSTLWPIFRHHRWLLNHIFRLPADILMNWAKKQGLIIGVFAALHTYGRGLNWNVHLHLSVTRGGLCEKTEQWKPLYFKAKETEKCWRAAIITLLNRYYSRFNLSADDLPFVRHQQDWRRFLASQYRRKWKLHFAKKTDSVKPTVKYLGRYLKRPPISASRLRHYSHGERVSFEYLNHRTNKTETLDLSAQEMIDRIAQHIPDKHFKMLRYYGFLSNRRRGELLPKVYKALEKVVEPEPDIPGYAAMLKGYKKLDPYECIVCQGRLVFDKFRPGEPLKKVINDSIFEAEMRAS